MKGVINLNLKKILTDEEIEELLELEEIETEDIIEPGEGHVYNHEIIEGEGDA